MKAYSTSILASYALAILCLLVRPLQADTITLKDGSVVHGKIVKIDSGTITFTTKFAGDLTIKQDQVSAYQTDEPMFVKTADKSVILGTVQPKAASGLVITSPSGRYATTVKNVKSSWPQNEEDPELVALRRHWLLEFSTDIAGKSGNATGFAGAIGAIATLKTPTDVLKFYANANRTTANGETSEDMYKGGVDYNAFFTPRWSWYVSTELMQDNVKDIALRVTTNGGIGWNAIRNPHDSLQFRAGLSYRYDTYNSVPPTPNFSSAGLDLGIVHRLELVPWAIMNNTLDFVPSFRDTSNFVIDHDSNLTMPIGASKIWSLQLGLSNEYTSKPVLNLKKLDTTYYVRFVYDVP